MNEFAFEKHPTWTRIRLCFEIVQGAALKKISGGTEEMDQKSESAEIDLFESSAIGKKHEPNFLGNVSGLKNKRFLPVILVSLAVLVVSLLVGVYCSLSWNNKTDLAGKGEPSETPETEGVNPSNGSHSVLPEVLKVGKTSNTEPLDLAKAIPVTLVTTPDPTKDLDSAAKAKGALIPPPPATALITHQQGHLPPMPQIDADAKQPPEKRAPETVDLSKLQLIAAVGLNASFRLPNGKTFDLSQGEMYGGYRLTKVIPQYVMFTTKDERFNQLIYLSRKP